MVRSVKYWAILASCLLTISTLAGVEVEEAKEEFFLSTPEQIATLRSDGDHLIGGVISPLSGHPVLRQTDLVVKGAQNVVLSRTYVPPRMPCSFPQHKQSQAEWEKYYLYKYAASNYKGWQFYPHLKLQFTPQRNEILLTDPNGVSLAFRLLGSTAALCSGSYGISNTAGDTPHGQYDNRNTRITYDGSDKITVYAPDGTIRFYSKTKWRSLKSYLFVLEKETLPNGKVLRYHYNGIDPVCVESLDPKERFVYARLQISGSPWQENCHFSSLSGLTVDYGYQRRVFDIAIRGKRKGIKFNEKYRFTGPPLLSSVSSPFFRQETMDYCKRFLLNSYSAKEEIFSAFHAGYGKPQHYRVHKLSLPIGPNDAFEPVYELHFDPPIAGVLEGVTTVNNSDGTSTAYHFSKNLLPSITQHFGQDGELKREKILTWDDKNWLKCIEIRDGQKNLFHRTSYEYDRFGNPVLEVFAGNLTGEGNLETFTIKRVFSDDGRNLLLREEGEDGKAICFSYLPSTNLATSKLTKEGDKIILRTFFVYDDCHNLIERISDDGRSENKDNLSGVTQKTITRYRLRQEPPYLHMPEWVEEKYWEGGTEKLLTKSHLLYDLHGNVAQEEVYDAEGRHAYTIRKTYNERGDLLSETNRLGQEAVYSYDAKGRIETATNFSHRLHTAFRHDAKGRLIEQTAKGDDGIVHATSWKHDFKDRAVEKKDPFQNGTCYAYDPMVDQIAKTDFPPIASLDGQAAAVTTRSTYDSLGRELAKTDANGNATAYRYTANGSTSEIFHPDGARESFRYAKNGQLASHTDPDGLTIRYARDILGRVLCKTYLSPEGGILAEESFIYNGFHLLVETDREGHVRRYSYDGAGKKIKEEFCGRITDFHYDPLGRLATIVRHNGDNTLLVHYTRDLEGRILEEQKSDASGHLLHKIAYAYDEDNHQKTITRYIHGQESVHAFLYDSFHRLTESKDSEGNINRTVYDEDYTNSLGQKTLRIATIDPAGITRLETRDALGRTAKKEILSPQRATLSCQEMIYDAQGNLLYQRDYIYGNEQFLRTQTVHYTRGPTNQIASITRAFGTHDARTTSYSYTSSGKIQTKILPDGTAIHYGYDPLGYLASTASSDGKIDYRFANDGLGRVYQAADLLNNITIEREHDPFGNTLLEKVNDQFPLRKSYDAFNRPLAIRLPDNSEILYSYSPLFLNKVSRTSSSGQKLYSHAFDEYDLAGNLLAETMIGNLGHLQHSYDPKGRKKGVQSPYFDQHCTYDLQDNLLSSAIDGVDNRYTYDGLSQLTSEPRRTYASDSHYNRIRKNEQEERYNALDELASCHHDLNGNLVHKSASKEAFAFTFDPLNQLTEARSDKTRIAFSYDPLGRRIQKTVYSLTESGWQQTGCQRYLYDDREELGAFTPEGKMQQLRIPGLPLQKGITSAVAVELEGKVFAIIHDLQGHIRRLLDPLAKKIIDSYEFTAFGERLNAQRTGVPFNPWCYACKRLDPELNLIDFGKRLYDPELGRWIITGPAGFINSTNLYQFLFNNPFRYTDPDRQFAFLPALVVPTDLFKIEIEADKIYWENIPHLANPFW